QSGGGLSRGAAGLDGVRERPGGEAARALAGRAAQAAAHGFPRAPPLRRRMVGGGLLEWSPSLRPRPSLRRRSARRLRRVRRLRAGPARGGRPAGPLFLFLGPRERRSPA